MTKFIWMDFDVFININSIKLFRVMQRGEDCYVIEAIGYGRKEGVLKDKFRSHDNAVSWMADYLIDKDLMLRDVEE